MNRRLLQSALVAITICFALVITFGRVSAQTTQPATPEKKTAVQAYKNIQVLKDVPAEELIPSMQFIAVSLGVECDFCHVRGAFDKDDKEPKKIARKMMQMMFAIDHDNFGDHKMVTCNTCHRGSPMPVSIPPVATAEMATAHPAPHEHEAPPMGENTDTSAQANQLIAKYTDAIGGAAALQKVQSRVEKGSISMPGGRQISIDVYDQAPGRRASIMHMPNGDSVTAFNGNEGWLSFPGRPIHDMTPAEAQGARLDADLQFPTDVTKVFSTVKLGPPDKIDGKDVNVVLAMNPDKPPVKLYFDPQTSLLVRELRYTETPLGLLPTQIDYADYRVVDGVKVPYQWTLARAESRFTIQATDVKQNAPISETVFAKPPAPPEPQRPPEQHPGQTQSGGPPPK